MRRGAQCALFTESRETRDQVVGVGAARREGGTVVVTGSSHLHLACAAVGDKAAGGSRGCWGAYRGAPLPYLSMAEGGPLRRLSPTHISLFGSWRSRRASLCRRSIAGQSSTGSALRFLSARIFASPDGEPVSLQELDAAAAEIPIGCDG